MQKTLLHELVLLMERKDRFTYDIRGLCQVYDGVVVAYRVPSGERRFTDLGTAIDHALEHDGILDCWKDADTGLFTFDSCRLFTDLPHAFRFARLQEQRAIHHLTRNVALHVLPDEQAVI